MVILNMSFEVLGQVLDALAEQSDLHFRGAGILLMKSELLHNSLYFRLSDSHVLRSSSRFLVSVKEFLTHPFDVVKAHRRRRDTERRASIYQPRRIFRARIIAPREAMFRRPLISPIPGVC